MNIALASCVTMCSTDVNFAKYQGIVGACYSNLNSNYEEDHFTLAIHLPEDLILENEQELLAFVDNFCRVKKLFREDIQVDISLAK